MDKKDLFTGKRIVAIVDDEKDITVLFKDMLQRIKGISIVTFNDPKIALEHENNNAAYALVLCDFKMPELNGMELIKKIKELNHFVRTILITAFAINRDLFQEYAKKKIIDNFLQKPIHLDDLIEEVNIQLHKFELQKK